MSEVDTRDFDQKYRPATLDRVIGNDKVITRLKGIIKSGKIPKAMLFVGPSSAGKTTLARAFVTDLFGVKTLSGLAAMDFHESNAADSRSVDDIRDLLKVVKLKPKTAPRRVFFIDECLTGDTLVEVEPNVFVSIKTIFENSRQYKSVLSFNEVKKQVEQQPITATIKTKKTKRYDIKLEDGSVFSCSDNHKWWCVNRNDWIRTDEIREQDELLLKPS